MKSLSRVHRYRADHALFCQLWTEGLPTVEIAYLLNLSKAQLAKHLAEVVEADLERPKPAYDVILVEELPHCLKKKPSFAYVPMCKVESAGDGLVLTGYDPEQVEHGDGAEIAEADTYCEDFAESEASAESQN